MSGSLNKVMLIGNLGRHPEIHGIQNGGCCVTFSLATSESWRDRTSGERRELTEWYNVVIFDEQLAEVASKYLATGSKVYIEGQLQTRKWQDKDGRERRTTEIVLSQHRSKLIVLNHPRRTSEHAAATATEQKIADDLPF